MAEDDFEFPDGWRLTYADSSLGSGAWELKEDLLQLHHPGLGRLADVGWYRDHFRTVIFQGDFHGELLSEVRTTERESVLPMLRVLLEKFTRE